MAAIAADPSVGKDTLVRVLPIWTEYGNMALLDQFENDIPGEQDP